jgi:hypothetical protein
MTIKYGLQFFFFELTDNDGQNFLCQFPNFNFDYRCHDDKNDKNRKWG